MAPELAFRRSTKGFEIPSGDDEADVGIRAIDVRDGVVAVEESANDLVKHQAAQEFHPHGYGSAIASDSNLESCETLRSS